METTSTEKLNKIFQEIERPIFDFELVKWGLSPSDMSYDDTIEVIQGIQFPGDPFFEPEDSEPESYTEMIENAFTKYLKIRGVFYMPFKEQRDFIKKIMRGVVDLNAEISATSLLDNIQEEFIKYFRLKLRNSNVAKIIFNNGRGYLNFNLCDKERSTKGLSEVSSIIWSFRFFIINECKDFLNIRMGEKGLGKDDYECYVSRKDLQINPYESLFSEIYQSLILYESAYEDFGGFILKDLAFSINKNNIDYGIEKPITTHILRDIISKNEKDFVYDTENDSVRLISNEEFSIKAEEELKNSYQLVKNFPKELSKTGILALVFIGKDFPLTEATEYVKVRSIIYLKEILETTNIHNLLGIEDSEIVNEDEDDIKYLKAILPKDTDYNDWLNNNLAVAFFDCSRDQAQLLTPQLIKKVSPVLNINQNPGNLFQQTLEQKLETYQKE